MRDPERGVEFEARPHHVITRNYKDSYKNEP